MDDAAESAGSFDTDLVDSGDDTTQDESGDNVNPVDLRRRILILDDSSSIVYADDGYTADDDSYEAGVVVDDSAFSDPIYADDNTPDDPDNAGSAILINTFGLWMLIVALYQNMA